MSNTSSLLPLTVADLVCIEDLDANGAETTSDMQTLVQDVYHVVIEKIGSNIDDIARGIGAENLLSGDSNALLNLAQVVESQLGEDDRIAGVTATVSQILPGGTLPDATLLPEGGFLLEIDIDPAASIAPSTQSITLYFAQSQGWQFA
jgi:hypothetical protein